MKKIIQWLLPSFLFGLSLSSSDAQTSNATEQREMHVVGGNDSTNVSANDSSITILATDHGAVSGGLNTASRAFEMGTQMVGDNTKTVLNAGLSMFDGALKSNTSVFGSALGAIKDSNSNALERMSLTTGSALAAVAGAREDVAAAWQDSQTPENGMLKIAGFVVVGIAAVGLFVMQAKK